MKYLLTLFFLSFVALLCAQSPVGIWQTIDDNEGDVRSEMELYLTDEGTLEGRVHHLFRPDAPLTCPRCPGDKKDTELIGLVIIWDLKEDGNVWCKGRIMNPENGKTYKCYIELEGEDKLKVRGYLGIAALGRTQVWHRKIEEVEPVMPKVEEEIVTADGRGGGF